MENQEDEAFNKFIQFHGLQLYAIQFPAELHRKLYDKLKNEIFDIGFKVKIIVNDEEEKVDLVMNDGQKLTKNEDVYLIDHAWTFKYRDCEKTLRENEKLLERMLNTIKYSNKLELPSNPFAKQRPTLDQYLASIQEGHKIYDLDEYGLKTLADLPFLESTEQISLFNNEIENPGEVSGLLFNLPNLKALWLNGNPVVENCVNFNQIGEFLPKLEVLNSKFTSKASDWAMLLYAADQQVSDVAEIRELDLSGKGVLHIKDIEVFERMKNLKVLNISDHPEFFMSEEEIKEEESKMKEGSPDQENIEFMKKLHSIDDLLNKLNQIRRLFCDEELEAYILQHREEKGFLKSLVEINNVPIKITDKDQREKEKNIRKVMDKIWMYAGTYRVVSEDQMDEENIWYIMDEVGSSIKHSDNPNMAVHPLIYAPNNAFDAHTITYSICWPTRDVNAPNETLYRDFLCGIDESKFRSTRFSVWFNTPEEYFAQQLEIYNKIKPEEDAMTVHNTYQEKYPPVPSIDAGNQLQLPIKVYSDYVQVQNHLTDKRFAVVDDPNDAAIVWTTMDYYNIVKPQITTGEESKYLNQYQYEGSFVMKHHLANLIRYTLGEEDQHIIQETFILNDTLPAFVGRFNEMKKKAFENTWILKPINMARSMDTWVTNNLDQILRLAETGPKISQKYIYNPCLFRGKKFDMRFVALLKSVLPLEVYVYDEFYTRHSNNLFEMSESSFSVYETHFTVMNYSEGVKLTNIRYFDFEKEFNEEYKGIITFDVIKERIYSAIKKVFLAFQVKHGKDLEALGPDSKRCRSLYGIDVMITDTFEPKILEVTFSPDCKRACVFNPDFFNDVFGCLFFNDAKNITKL